MVLAGGYVAYRKSSGDPSQRSAVLQSMLGSSMFTWTFLGASLALCTWFLPQYTEGTRGVLGLVLGSSLLVSISVSAGMFLLARRIAVSKLAAKMTLDSPQASSLNESFDSLTRGMNVRASLREATVGNAFSISLDGNNIVGLSAEISESLSGEEVEAVLAHELSHIKNKDSRTKGLARIAHFAFPFDPVIRLVEAAVHRERELLADRTAATFTKKPMALASALLKACSTASPAASHVVTGLCVGGQGRGLLSLYPDLERRIDVLVELSKRMRLQQPLVPSV